MMRISECASLHCIGIEIISDAERKTIRLMDKPLDLDTVSGIVQATHEATVYVKELVLNVAALVMPESPPLLSVGLLVKDLGMTFAFDQDGAALTRKSGVRIYCADMHNVPI